MYPTKFGSFAQQPHFLIIFGLCMRTFCTDLSSQGNFHQNISEMRLLETIVGCHNIRIMCILRVPSRYTEISLENSEYDLDR